MIAPPGGRAHAVAEIAEVSHGDGYVFTASVTKLPARGALS
jgi:hypothetical protein